jgi:hypothetical protein
MVIEEDCIEFVVCFSLLLLCAEKEYGRNVQRRQRRRCMWYVCIHVRCVVVVVVFLVCGVWENEDEKGR